MGADTIYESLMPVTRFNEVIGGECIVADPGGARGGRAPYPKVAAVVAGG